MEEVDLEVPIRWDPQESLAHADKGGRLRDRVRREVVQIHAIVVAQPAHKVASRRRETPLMETDEADDLAGRRSRLPVCRRRDDPRRGLPVHVWNQLAVVLELVQCKRRHRRARPQQRVEHDDGLRRSHANR